MQALLRQHFSYKSPIFWATHYTIGSVIIGGAHAYNFYKGHLPSGDIGLATAMTVTWPVSGPLFLWAHWKLGK